MDYAIWHPPLNLEVVGMVRSHDRLSRQGTKGKESLPLCGHQHPIKDAPHRVKLLVRPGVSSSAPADLAERKVRIAIIEPLNSRPINIVIGFIL
jgi:hypothetical protein